MDFTLFANRDIIPALAWLGRREWLEFGCGSFEQRTIWTRTKELVISDEERSKYSPEHWKHVHEIVQSCSKDVVASFLSLALSKSIAGGPKVFQPTVEDCEALENTECSMSFEEYKQPYPVVIIEFPKVYRQKLARIWKVAYGPSHVIVHHDKDFITVNAFFDRKNVISHITPSRPEYKTIEDAIALNKDKNEEADVNAAELAQRLAINFCMVMVLLGVRQVGPLDKESFEKAKKLARSPDEKKAALGKKLVSSAMYKLQFIQQKIKLYEEEFIEPRSQEHRGEGDPTRASPKPHWRRGHYRNQWFGSESKSKKLVFIKPVFVRAAMFGGHSGDTEVVYKITTKDKQ